MRKEANVVINKEIVFNGKKHQFVLQKMMKILLCNCQKNFLKSLIVDINNIIITKIFSVGKGTFFEVALVYGFALFFKTLSH